MYSDAAKQIQKAIEVSRGAEEHLCSLAILYAVSGKKEESYTILDGILKNDLNQYLAPYPIALAYSCLNDRDQAFAWLEKSYENRESPLANLMVEPLFDNLRSDPRFADLKMRMGLWR